MCHCHTYGKHQYPMHRESPALTKMPQYCPLPQCVTATPMAKSVPNAPRVAPLTKFHSSARHHRMQLPRCDNYERTALRAPSPRAMTTNHVVPVATECRRPSHSKNPYPMHRESPALTNIPQHWPSPQMQLPRYDTTSKPHSVHLIKFSACRRHSL